MKQLVSLVMLAMLLAGCGVKRPLKLPEEEKQKQESSVLQTGMPGQNLPQPAASGGTTYTIEPK